MTASGAVHYRLLGPLAALRGGEPLDLGSPKQRAVLALLLLHRGRVVSTDRLIDAVWPVDVPASATASLQAYISNLRRALRDEHGGTSPIAWRSSGYAIDVPPAQLDVTSFAAAAREAHAAAEDGRWSEALEQADAALAEWHGPLLQDLADEAWVRTESDAIDELLAEARETRTTALLAEGRIAEAIVQAQQLVAEAPLRGRGCWLLMVALYRGGRAPESLERYREHAEHLDEALGLEAGTELRELQLSILRQEPSLAAWPRAPGWQGAAEVVEPSVEPASAPLATEQEADPSEEQLVGRERERELLDRVLAESQSGSVRWLVMTGPAGIGKTRLAEELVVRTRALGGRDAWARCPEDEGTPAWWPIRQLVRTLGGDPDAVLLAPTEGDADEARFTIYERVAALLESAAEASGPLTLVIDDAQWADATSARCLAYLAGAMRSVPVTFALTLRDGEDDRTVRPLLMALARTEGHRQLAVTPLGERAVRELADRVASAPLGPTEAGILYRRTGGNPLFVREYARLDASERTGGESVPLAVRSVLGRRLDGLDPGVVHVLRAAAVVGDVVELDLVAAITRLDPDEVADLLDDAADEHIVVPAQGAGGYAFGHGLLREEVLAQMPTLRRQRLHARVAAILAEQGAEPSLRARHLLQALPVVDPADALEACRAAALVDVQRSSSETAADWWNGALRAFDMLPAGERTADARDDLIIARVDALALAGRRRSLLDVIENGILDAVRDGRISTVGRLAASLLRATGSWPWVSSLDDPGRLQARLFDLEALVAGNPVAEARLQAALAVGSIYEPDRSIPERHSRRAIELAEELGDPEVLADALLGRIITFSGIASHREECLALIERLTALPHRYSRVDEPVCHGVAVMATLNLGRVEAAAEHLRLGIVGADVLRLPALRVQLRWAQGLLAHWRGELDEASGHYALAVEVHQQTELHSEAAGDVPSHILEWDRGRLAELDDPGMVEPVAWEAAIAAARGQTEAARDALRRWVFLEPRPMVWTTLGHATLMAHVAVDLADEPSAARLVTMLEAYPEAIAIVGHVGVIGSVALALARLYAFLGRADEARAMLTRATEAAHATGGLPTLLRCRLLAVELGEAEGPPPVALEAIAAEADAHGLGGISRLARRSLT